MRAIHCRFNIRQVLIFTFGVAAVTAIVVAFGPHFLRAPRHIAVNEFQSMAEVKLSAPLADFPLSTCVFNGISFNIPTGMLNSPKVVRRSATDLWLEFEDDSRQLHIPLGPANIRASIATPPSVLENLSLPQLLCNAVSAASADFSFGMSRTELVVLDWAMEARTALNLDAQQIDRFSKIENADIHAILLSADPTTIDSKRRLRSILVWETRKQNHQALGSIWFGDSSNLDVKWIDEVASSLNVKPDEQLTSQQIMALSDAEILSLVHYK